MANYWDEEAASYDDAPDHGLDDPAIRGKWAALLGQLLPAAGRVLDVGCGTGSLSHLVAALGHDVVGLDSSAEMLKLARKKAAAADVSVDFVSGDAASPTVSLGQFDVLLGRHILWALADLPGTLLNWSRLLSHTGCMIIIEGFWSTGVGLHMEQVLAALPANMVAERAFSISADSALWGRDVTDERFVVVAKPVGC